MDSVKARRSHRSHGMDMTEGSIVKKMIVFAIPLLLGNLFQQLYNMVDTWVIGQTGVNEAYAAVGSVGPIINMLLGFFLGLSSGAGVVISQYFGAKEYEKVSRTVHTSVAMTLVLGVVLTVVGVLLTPWMLRLLLHTSDTSSPIFAQGNIYLRIYFAGIAAMMLYNIGAGILRAVGDSRRPFYFLVVSAVTNTVLDLIFVFRFDMGVAGVAWATVLAQALSMVLTFFVLCRSDLCIKLFFRKIRFDFAELRKIIRVGIPSAIQTSLTAFSNVFVQSYVARANGVQEYVMGGWTSYNKLDQFIFLPAQSLALVATTFVGQNLGVGNVERAKKGVRVAWLTSTVISILIIVPVMAFSNFFGGIFNPDPNVVGYASLLLRYLTPFYLFCSVNQIYNASLRGAGNARAPMIIMISSFVVLRQIYLFVITRFVSNELLAIGFSYPAGWGFCTVVTLLYYHHYKFGHVDLVGDRTAKA